MPTELDDNHTVVSDDVSVCNAGFVHFGHLFTQLQHDLQPNTV
jgi:hypothetical protein